MPTARTIFCPACGALCGALRTDLDEDEETAVVRCPAGHGWIIHIDWASIYSDDGTAIISFQCDGTPAYALPEVAP